MPPDGPYNTRGQLDEAFLSEINFSRNLDFNWGDAEGITYTIDSHVDAEVSDNREQGVARLYANFTFHYEGEEREPPFNLATTVTGRFVGFPPGLPDEEIEGWLTFNAQHMLWPYLRTYVSQITANSGLPALTIYTIGVPRPHLGQPDDPPARERADVADAEPAP